MHFICRGGGIGRHAGLKIPWGQLRVGSSPTRGTTENFMTEFQDVTSVEQVQQFVPGVQRLGVLALDLARIDRATMRGVGMPESDTDHTVMVVLVAVDLAERDPRVDSGKVAKLAATHELVEARARDTQTFYPDDELMVGKKAREEAGFAQLSDEIGATSPQIIGLVKEYETGESLERSLVKLVDKLVRPIVHLHDDCNALLARGMTLVQHDRNVAKTYELMAEHMERFPFVATLWRELDNQVRDRLAARLHKNR